MKVFTNTNFATGKADAAIEANVVVGLSTTTGDVIQAVAATVPIGVSHNYATDAGQPVTIVPIGAGFARVKAGEELVVGDLGSPVGADATGRVVKTPTKVLGILTGLSADVEGALSAAAGDDVVVMLTGDNDTVYEAPPAPVATTGKLKFVATAAGAALAGVEIDVTVTDGTLMNVTNAAGEHEFELAAGTYAWTAELATYTITPASGSATVAVGETKIVELSAVQG